MIQYNKHFAKSITGRRMLIEHGLFDGLSTAYCILNIINLYCGAHDDRVFLEPESDLWELSKRGEVDDKSILIQNL